MTNIQNCLLSPGFQEAVRGADLKNGRGRTGIYHLSLGDGDGSALPAEKYRESGKKAFRRGYGGGSVRSAFHELRVCGVCL